MSFTSNAVAIGFVSLAPAPFVGPMFQTHPCNLLDITKTQQIHHASPHPHLLIYDKKWSACCSSCAAETLTNREARQGWLYRARQIQEMVGIEGRHKWVVWKLPLDSMRPTQHGNLQYIYYCL